MHAPARLRSLLRMAALLLAPAAARADLVTNGSFAQGFMGWTQPGAPAVQYSIVTSTRDGSSAARVANRSAADDSVRQNLASALAAAGSGAGWTARAWVAVDEPASARLMLFVVDAAGSRQEILAERVLRTPDAWELLEGSRRIAFQPPLTSAILFVRLERIGEGLYPSFTLDDAMVELDADLDALTDPEEGAGGTRADAEDSDGDGMSDAWEVRAGLDPLADNASADADGDGFTDAEEWWAATSPRDPAAQPGRPSTALMGPAARCLLRWLALLPSRSSERLLVGQHLSYPAPPNDEYGAYVDAFATRTGRYPGLLCLQYDDGANPVQVAAVNPYALSWWQAGGILQIKWNPHNPFTGGSYQDRTFTSFQEVLTPGTAANQHYMMQLAQVGDGLQELRDAGVVVLWRLCSEMNGGWFWWGHRDRQGYVDFWRFTHDYLTRQRGLDNLIWVYESDSGVHAATPADYYFPGDDVVDVFGHNVYDDDWSLSFDADRLYRPYGKVHAVPQAGPKDAIDGTFSNMTYLDGRPAGTGGARHALPRLSYLAAWNSFSTWDPALGQSVPHAMALVDNLEAEELVADPWVITRDEVAASLATQRPGRASLLFVTKPAGALHFSWTDAQRASDHVVHEDGTPNGGFIAATGSAVAGAAGLDVPMPAGNVFYRVAGRNDCGESDLSP